MWCRIKLLHVRKASVRLISVAAALGAALACVPAALASPAPTKLDLSGPGKAPGGTTTLTARLTAGGKPLAGRTVGLYDSGPEPIAAGNTDGAGRIGFEVHVATTTAFQAGYTPVTSDAALYLPVKSNVHRVAPTSGVDLSVLTYLHAGGRSVGIPNVPVRLRGTTVRFSPGSTVMIEVFKGARRVYHKAHGVARAGAKGVFRFAFRPRSRGVYRVGASDSTGSRTVHIFVVNPRAGQGSRGTAVRALQSRLTQLGYRTRVTGYFDDSTAREVLAFRKVNGYARTRTASPQIFRKLARGAGGYGMRYPGAGKHVEFDWSRQVLVLARGAKPDWIIPASSGKPSTPTVFGKFNFYSKTPGYNEHGMYFSNYFIGGYAVHGYASVPDYAASHGCIRIPIPNAVAVYGWIGLGDPIYVYR